jgi:hypothetical protein
MIAVTLILRYTVVLAGSTSVPVWFSSNKMGIISIPVQSLHGV